MRRTLFIFLCLFLLPTPTISASASSLRLGWNEINSAFYAVAYKSNTFAELPVAYEVANTETSEAPALKKPIARISVTSPDLEVGQSADFDYEGSEFWGSSFSVAEWHLDGVLVTSPPDSFSSVGKHIVGLRVRNTEGVWSNLTQHSITVKEKYYYSNFNDFKKVQGYQGWYYKYKSLTTGIYGDLTYPTSGTYWGTSVNPFIQVYQGAVHPGTGYETVILWKAPRAGVVDISVFMQPGSALSDGMSFSLYVRGSVIETYNFAGGSTEVKNPTITSITLSEGDDIAVHQNPLATNNSDAATLVLGVTYHK